MNLMPNTQPISVTPPIPTPLPLPNNDKRPKIALISVVVVIILLFFTLLLNYLGLISLSSPFSFLPTQNQVVIEVAEEKIYKKELDNVKALFAFFEKKKTQDPSIVKEATDFVINRRLLEKEAKKRSIDISKIVAARFTASLKQYGSEENLEKALNTNSSTYKNYLTYQALKEFFISSTIKWKIVDVFSIRYLYDDNAPVEEKNYKEVVDKKIQQYYTKIKDGLDIREAIKERCSDKEINFLPYDPNNKVYTTGFNGKICREQNIDLKVSKNTNSLWGEKWLQQIFETTKKGEISPIIDFTNKNIGMYFIVKVLDEGGDSLSFDDLISALRSSTNIKFYLKI